MANITVVVAVALVALGIIGYLPHRAATALIPAYIGAVLLILGLVAQKPAARKHAMHAVVIIALLGCVGASWRLIKAGMGGTYPSGLAVFSQVGTALLTLLLVVLCVRSFINARRNPQPGANPTS